MKNALIVWGGWDGHEPKQCAEFFAPKLKERGFTIVREYTGIPIWPAFSRFS